MGNGGSGGPLPPFPPTRNRRVSLAIARRLSLPYSRGIRARFVIAGPTLVAELDRRGIRTKASAHRDGQKSGGIRFDVGSLAYLLKNRLYIGEITYRGEVHRGEHEPILSRDLFEAVQAKRAANAVDRQIRLRGSAAILTGRLFDDRGNRMSPTHTNKQGARYRYYVSHALPGGPPTPLLDPLKTDSE